MNVQLVNFLSQLKVASLSRKRSVLFKYNKPAIYLLKSLYKEGLITSYSIMKKDDSFHTFVELRFSDETSLLSDLKIVSTPSRTVYINYKEISKLCIKNKTFFFSTDKGILSDSECKRLKIGGVLYFVC
jgi:small subunit ribosomal protein S8